MTFASWLAEQRVALGLTQKDLAARLNVSPQYLNDIERGRRNPPYALVEQIAQVLKADPDLLYVLCGRIPPDLLRGQQDKVLEALRAVRAG